MSSKSKVNFSYKKIRSKVIPILKLIEEEYPTKIASLLKMSKQNVFYYIKKLEKAGIIVQKTRSSIAVYRLTLKGKEFLGGCEGPVFSSNIYRLHNCRIKYPIYQEGRYPQGGFRKVELVNWVALLGLEQGVAVRKTTKHWIVECGSFYGKNPSELLGKAMNLGNRVANGLSKKYFVGLGEGKIQKGYELAIDDPVADFVSRYFCVSTSNRKIDHSELTGEIDNLSKDSAIEYLLMPERIEKIEKDLGKMSDELAKINCNVQSLLGLSSQFDDLMSGVNQLVEMLKKLMIIGVEDLISNKEPEYYS